MNRKRLEFATKGFLAAMRREWVKMNPDKECPVKRLEDYAPADRSALMNAIRVSIDLSGSGGEASFENWLQRQNQSEQT